MSKKKHWQYSHVASSSCGTMICTACKKEISRGEFRYHYHDEKGYSCQHRKCSQSDENWAILDAESAEKRKKDEERLKAYIEFREKWDEEALDEEIASMKHYLTLGEPSEDESRDEYMKRSKRNY